MTISTPEFHFSFAVAAERDGLVNIANGSLNMAIESERIVRAGREWLSECSFRDIEPDSFHDPEVTPDAAILAGIDKLYSGGMTQFVKDL